MKVPNARFDIIDNQNSLVYGEIICANITNTADCTLYFKANLRAFDLTYYKLIPNDKTKSTVLLQREKMGRFSLKKKLSISDLKTV